MSNNGTHPLRQHRKRRNLTQQMLADFTQLNVKTIERAENGKPISTDSRKRICDFFSLSALDLSLLTEEDENSDQNRENDMNRRDTLKLLGATGASMVIGNGNLPLWERLSFAIKKPSKISETELLALETVTKGHWQLRSTLGYEKLLGGFTEHLENITQLLQDTHPTKIHSRLCSLASEVAQHTGAIYFDMNDHISAHKYYNVSIQAANEIGDYNLCALGFGRMSSLPIYSGTPVDALPMLNKAKQLASNFSKPSTYAWLAAIEAEAYANLGNELESLKSLEESERALEDRTETDSDDVKFDLARLAGYRGTCLLKLKHPREAFSSLSDGLNLIDAKSTRQKAIMLVDSAIACVLMGKIEEGTNLATMAFQSISFGKSGIVVKRLHEFQEIINSSDAKILLKNASEVVRQRGN